jgi:hypothetical protein
MSLRDMEEVAKQTYFDPSGFRHLDLNMIWFHRNFRRTSATDWSQARCCVMVIINVLWGFECIAAERFVDFPASSSAEYQCGTFRTINNHIVQNLYVLIIHSVS